MPKKKPLDVHAYIADAAEEARPILNELRTIIRSTVPKAEEIIAWSVPIYKHHGIVAGYDVAKAHVSFGIDSMQADDREKLVEKGYKTGSKTIQIKFGQKVPVAMIKKLLKAQVKLNQAAERSALTKPKPLKSSTPKKMNAYESFSAWEKEESKTNPLTKVVARHVRGIAPHLEVTVKWGQGCFVRKSTPVIFIHTETDHIQLGFYNGTTLKDPRKLLEGKGKFVRHIKIVTKKDIQAKEADSFIKQVL